MRQDAVTPEVREAVLRRDEQCFLYRLDVRHVCRDRFGPHSPFDLHRLTVDHVHMGGGMMGKRAPSDAKHLTAMCYWGNVITKPSADIRAEQRAYLAHQGVASAATPGSMPGRSTRRSW